MKTGSPSEQIGKVVRVHLAQAQAEATVALEQAFARSAKATTPSKKRSPCKHRGGAQLAELAEHEHERIVAKPGVQMTRHAEQLGTRACESGIDQ